MTIEKAMNVFRQLQTRSHSFASAFGSVSAAVTIMILPSFATSIRAISTPAAIAARMARVTSCCRNVQGARAMGVNKSAYRGSERRLTFPLQMVNLLCQQVGNLFQAHPFRKVRVS